MHCIHVKKYNVNPVLMMYHQSGGSLVLMVPPNLSQAWGLLRIDIIDFVLYMRYMYNVGVYYCVYTDRFPDVPFCADLCHVEVDGLGLPRDPGSFVFDALSMTIFLSLNPINSDPNSS